MSLKAVEVQIQNKEYILGDSELGGSSVLGGGLFIFGLAICGALLTYLVVSFVKKKFFDE